MVTENPSGWHIHPHMYPTQAWRDEMCPNPSTAVPIPSHDERAIQASAYPVVSR